MYKYLKFFEELSRRYSSGEVVKRFLGEMYHHLAPRV
jgi:hypothetical protein